MIASTGQIPRYLKHVTMAILRDRRASSFEDAFDIARARLTELGFLKRGSDKGMAANIKLTTAGERKNREFARRPMRQLLAFDRLYAKSKWAGSDMSESATGPKRE